MIPGSFPIAAGVPRPLFQFKTSATFANINGGPTTMVFPASIVPGDLVVMWDVSYGLNVPALKAPPGFIVPVSDTFPGVSNPPPNPAGIVFAYKFAEAADAGRTFVGMDANGESCTIIIVFSPIATPFKGYASGSPHFDLGFGGVPPAQTITAGAAATISFGLYMQVAGTFSPTFSPASDGFVSKTGFSLRTGVSYKIFNSDPTDVVVGLGTAPNTNGLASCRIDGLK